MSTRYYRDDDGSGERNEALAVLFVVGVILVLLLAGVAMASCPVVP